MPLLSVLLPVYNCRRYLAEAVRSIQRQTFADFEFIIVDDGSTDGSGQLVERFAAKDPRIRAIRQANTGIVGALNAGIAVASGDLIARMDADDVALPERFERQLAYLKGAPDCVIVGTAAWFTDPRGAVVDRLDPPTDPAGIEQRLLRGDGGALPHPTVIMRRAALSAAGGYRAEFDKAEDLDLFFRLIELGRPANLSEPLLYYRLHPASTCFAKRDEQRRLVDRILTRERGRRGLAPDVYSNPTGHTDISRPQLHRQWACTSWRYGHPLTALRHGVIGLLMEPWNRSSWGTIRYVIGQILRRENDANRICK